MAVCSSLRVLCQSKTMFSPLIYNIESTLLSSRSLMRSFLSLFKHLHVNYSLHHCLLYPSILLSISMNAVLFQRFSLHFCVGKAFIYMLPFSPLLVSVLKTTTHFLFCLTSIITQILVFFVSFFKILSYSGKLTALVYLG